MRYLRLLPRNYAYDTSNNIQKMLFLASIKEYLQQFLSCFVRNRVENSDRQMKLSIYSREGREGTNRKNNSRYRTCSNVSFIFTIYKKLPNHATYFGSFKFEKESGDYLMRK